MASLNVFIAAVAVALMLSSIPAADALTQAATRCPPGSSPSIVACRAPATALTPISGSGNCCSCPFGSFSANGISCARCTNGLVAQHGVDLSKTGTQCFCIDGYGDYDANSLTCRRCPINTYSLNGKCVACATGTFAPAQSSSCSAVTCPTNSYLPPGGATMADCVRCKYGAAAQSCGSVQGCSCEPGFAAFDKTTGQCQLCPSNAIAVYADETKPDETVTKCDPCPIGTIASADRRTCTAVSSTASSDPYPVTPIPAITCKSNTCSNGLSFTIDIVDPTGSSASISLPNTYGPFSSQDTGNVPNTPFPTTVDGALIADADTNLVVAFLKIENGILDFSSSNNDFLHIKAIGKTCAEFSLVYSAGAAFPCISLKSSSTPVSIVSLFQDQGLALVNADYDVLVSFQCGTNIPFSGCTDQNIVLVADSTQQRTSSSSNYATVTGSGTANFGASGIAFYGSDNNVVSVLTTSDNLNMGNLLFSRDVNAFPLIGQPCATSSTIIQCVPITSQLISLNDLLNAVDPTAVTSDYKLYSECA